MANVRAHVIVRGERFADLVASLSRLTDRAEARRAAPAAEPGGLALAR